MEGDPKEGTVAGKDEFSLGQAGLGILVGHWETPRNLRLGLGKSPLGVEISGSHNRDKSKTQIKCKTMQVFLAISMSKRSRGVECPRSGGSSVGERRVTGHPLSPQLSWACTRS